MVAGHLSVKHGNYYAVLNYKNAEGKRKTKWISLGLPEKGNKRKAEAELAKLRAEFEVPEEVGDLSSDMLFADYLLEWLEIAKGRLAVATYCSYTAMIKNPIAPYFRKKKLTLRELEARHLQMFYSEQLKRLRQTPSFIITPSSIRRSNMRSRPICYCRMWRTRLTDRRKTTFSLFFFRQRKCRRCLKRSEVQG